MKKHTFVDVFCGCGGLSYGLETSGMQCLLGIDNHKDSIKTFRENHRVAKTFLGDIRDLKNSQLLKMCGQQVDFVVGGPPCQGFSTLGKGDPDDPRNFLFLEFLRVVKALKPNGILFENVPAILAPKNKSVLNKIVSMFERQGYLMSVQVLSADSYGVPERRQRAFIVGLKKGLEFDFPRPTHGVHGRVNVRTVRDALKGISKTATHNDPQMAQLKCSINKKRLSYIPEGGFIRYRRDEERYLPKKLHLDVVWQALPEGRFRENKFHRLDSGRPSPTITTSRTAYYHPTEDRYLTAREAAAIQSFPNSFKFVGSPTSVFRQIGNAVPVRLAYVLGKSLQKYFL